MKIAENHCKPIDSGEMNPIGTVVSVQKVFRFWQPEVTKSFLCQIKKPQPKLWL